MQATVETRAEPPTGARRTPWPRVLVLALAVVLCYANSLRVPFLFDDPFLVAERPDVRLDYSTRPLVWATFDLDRALFGRNTAGYHVFNALVHLACALLLFGLVRRALARAAPQWAEAGRTNVAWVVALLWLCHPLQTESVTYLSQRAEALGALFTLLVLLAFERSLSSARAPAWQGLAWLALALGFLTKETVATAPLLVLLYDWVFVSAGPWKALRRRPLFYAGLALVALGCGAAFIGPLLRAERISAGFKLQEFSALEYARSQPAVLLHYLRLAFWPHPLCFDYAWPAASGSSAFLPQTIGIALLLAGTLVLLLRRSWAGFVGASFFLFLAPSSSFVPIRDLAVEHRMYLPLAAVIVLVVVAVRQALVRLAPRARGLAPALAGLAALALAAATVARNRAYASAEGLWRATVALAPHNARAHGNLGAALLEEGRAQEAIAPLLEALKLAPDEGFVLLDLGKAYWKLGERPRALPFLQRGVERAPDARGLGALGSVQFELGDFAGATQSFRKALALEPEDAGAHYRLANALGQLGSLAEAEQHFREALRLAPTFQEAHINLAALLAAGGRAGEALQETQAALALEPNTALELYNHAQLLSLLGRDAEALAFLRQAAALAPEMSEPPAALAELLARELDASPEERAEALRLARQARELAGGGAPELEALVARLEAQSGAPPNAGPQTAEEFFGLGQELRGLGRLEEAAGAFRSALRLAPELPEPHAALAEALVGKPGATAGERAEARREAERAVVLAGEPRAEILGILALSQAASGEHEAAVATLDRALALPALAENPSLAEQLRAQRARCLAAQRKKP